MGYQIIIIKYKGDDSLEACKGSVVFMNCCVLVNL